MPETIHDARSIWGLLQRRAEVDPDLPFLFDGTGRSLTVGQLRQRAVDAAGNLAAAGVVEGTVVSWQLPTWIDTVALSLALSRLGAVQNPILHVYREREVRFVLDQLRPSLFVVPARFGRHDYAAMARGISAELESPPEILVMGEDLFEPSASPLPPAPGATPDGEVPRTGDVPDGDEPVRWIYYTSGTSSAPKGVRHTDETLLAGGRALALALGLGEGDVGSIAFPFTHIAGPDYLVMMLHGRDPRRARRRLPAGRGHRAASPATASPSAVAARPSTRRTWRSSGSAPERCSSRASRLLSGGGAPKPPEIFYEVLGEMGVRTVHGYAMTEVPMLAMGRPSDDDEQLANTDGRPVAGAELRVVDPEGNACPVGVDGEVRVRGPMVCKGYVDEAQTAEAFDDEGWFRTGDVGHLRAGRAPRDHGAHQGHHHPQGREHLRQGGRGPPLHPSPGGRGGRDRAARPRPGRAGVRGRRDRRREPSALTFDEMVGSAARRGLMTQKIPEQLEIVERLPRNETLNKILKEQLRRQFSAPVSAP